MESRNKKRSAQHPEGVYFLCANKRAMVQRFYSFCHALPLLLRTKRQSRQLKFPPALCGLIFLMAMNADYVKAADINVDSTTCTLMDAIYAANSDSPSGGCPAGSGADDINLSPDSDIMLDQVIYEYPVVGKRGLPPVESEMRINGQNSTISRSKDSVQNFGILAVLPGGHLTITGINIVRGEDGGGGVYVVDGFFGAENSSISNHQTDGGGAAIIFYGGSGEINNSKINDNSTGNFDSYLTGEGGAVQIENGAQVTITDTEIKRNEGWTDAGALFIGPGSQLWCERCTVEANSQTFGATVINQGTVHIDGCSFSGNSTVETGPAVLLNFGEANVSDTTFENNETGSGAGVWDNYGTLNSQGDTIRGNRAPAGPSCCANHADGVTTLTEDEIDGNSSTISGAFENHGRADILRTTFSGNSNTERDGGAIANYQGTVVVDNSTFFGNSAADDGGAIYNDADIIITFSTFTNNIALQGGGGLSIDRLASAELWGNLFTGNTASYGPEVYNHYLNPVPVVDGYNIFGADNDPGTAGAFFPGPLDFVPPPGTQPWDIVDLSLGNHGGPTSTLALPPGSFALNLIPDSVPGCAGTDQRGISRPQDSGCEPGAFEEIPQLPCTGDFDGDGDVDGIDVAALGSDPYQVPLDGFAEDFGRENCGNLLP